MAKRAGTEDTPHTYKGRFMFFGEAIAFGARLDTPAVADARAAVALPSIGGRVAASEGGYLLDGGFISFDSAASEVVGEVDGDVHTTRATTRIIGFKIDGVIAIDKLTVTLKSTHDTKMQGDPLIHLSVDPFEITWPKLPRTEVKLWEGCNRHPTHKSRVVSEEAVSKALRGATPDVLGAFDAMQDAASRAALNERAVAVVKDRQGLQSSPGGGAAGGKAAYISQHDDNITWWALDSSDPGANNWAPLRPRPVGEVLQCDAYLGATGVGLYFGEYAVTRGRRRFTALRVEFERSPASEVVSGEVSVNGSYWP